MKRTFLVHDILGFKGWETCFRYLIEKAETFQIIFQGNTDLSDADEDLNTGKKEFLSLPEISISPYMGMEDSIEVIGELNMGARELFLIFMEAAFREEGPALCCFRFLKGNATLLLVADFSIGHLSLEESELEDLRTLGVDESNLLEIDDIPEQDPDIKVLGWSEEELSYFVSELHKALSNSLDFEKGT